MIFYKKRGTPKTTIGLSKEMAVDALFGLTFMIGSLCVPYFDKMTPHSEYFKDARDLEMKPN